MLNPAVTIAICTCNRAASLQETLLSLDSIDIPAEMPAELLVVDNGSSDDTPQILAEAPVRRLPVRTVREERKGLSHARNAAIANSTGRVLLWTDDDVRVHPAWLSKMAKPILSGEADATVGTVLIPPSRQQKLANTALRNHMIWVASTDEIDFLRPRTMIGANMAFGRHVLEKVPKFDCAFGPGPDAVGFGDDTMFSAMLQQHGFRLVGVKDAVVEHHFDLSRLDQNAIVGIAERMGRSQAYMDALGNVPQSRHPRTRLMLAHLAHRARQLRLWASAAPIIEKQEEQVYFAVRKSYWKELLRQRRPMPGRP